MKKLLLTLAVVALLALLWVVFRPGPAAPGYSTPVECVRAYLQAVKAADAAQYLRCLDERLRADVQRQFASAEALAENLRHQGKDLRNWVLLDDPQAASDRATVTIEQQYSTGKKRQQIHLQQIGACWHITLLAKAQDVPSDVPYDTHVSQVP